MELSYVLLFISTASTFFNGYFCRKGNVPAIITCSLVAQIPTTVNITAMGITKFTQHIVRAQTQNWIEATIYIAFFWGLGYALGGINIKKKDSQDDLPVRDVKHEEFRLD